MEVDTEDKADWKSNFVSLIVLCVAAAGLWVATMSAYENILFSKATDQMLGIVSRARDLMQGTAVSMRPGEDILNVFKKERFMSGVQVGTGGAYLINPWGQKTISRMDSVSDLKIETMVPTYVCRRMVEFFGKEANGFGFVKAEAKDHEGAVGRQMFVAPRGQQRRYSISPAAIEIGCGQDQYTILAIAFSVKQLP